MKVILEAQWASDRYLRGIPYYSKSLINTLLRRNTYEYGLTLFDYNKERGNKETLLSRLENRNAAIYECNTLNYRDIIMNEQPFTESVSYDGCLGVSGDVYHFMSQHFIAPGISRGAVITIHDLMAVLHPEWFPDEMLTISAKITLDRIESSQPHIITVSESSKNDMLNENTSLADKVTVIYESYQEDEIYPDADTAQLMLRGLGRPYILYTGAIDMYKGIEKLLIAYDIIAEKHKEPELVFIGGESVQCRGNFEKLILQSKHKDRIRWLGAVDNDFKRVTYSCAEMFVFPSLYEGFGIPVLEAMACGTPVITSNTSSLPEVAGDAAILISPADVEQLAYEMERVLTSQSLRNGLIKKGFDNCKRFSWDKAAQMTEEVYKIAYESRY